MCLSSGKNLLFYLFVRRVVELIAVMIKTLHFSGTCTKFYLTFFCQG